VTYAKQVSGSDDEKDGLGLGFVDAFLANGQFLARVGTHGPLDAPWGLAWAPDSFGHFGGDLIVGNFGNGRLLAYGWNGRKWTFEGTVRKPNHAPVIVHGLWGIAFGGGTANNGPLNTLFYAAGPNHEAGGAFGTITVAP